MIISSNDKLFNLSDLISRKNLYIPCAWSFFILNNILSKRPLRFSLGLSSDSSLDLSLGKRLSVSSRRSSKLFRANGSSTGITIEYTPFADSNVEVKINGIGVNLGNGVLTKDCYFSNDGGITPKLIKNIEAGDILYWNGANAGYELDPLDDIDFEYEASNLDL